MELVPFAVVFSGYTLVWYGWALLKGPGMGFLDLLVPARWGHADAVVASWSRVKKPSGLNPGAA